MTEEDFEREGEKGKCVAVPIMPHQG
jgi:hypothetical protein